MNLKDSNFFTFSYHVSSYLHHKKEGIIPVNVQNILIIYQFLL